MSRATASTPDDSIESTYRSYVCDVQILVTHSSDTEGARYRFEAPQHVGRTFEDPERAELYAAVYFDVNGFEEAGTGERGVPPEIIQAGRDTLIAYFRTQPTVDCNWLASYYGEKPEKIDRYLNRVRKRARKIREGVSARDNQELQRPE